MPDRVQPLYPGALLLRPTPAVEQAARAGRWPVHTATNRAASAALVLDQPAGLPASLARWAQEMEVPVVAEATALELLAELESPLVDGWCECDEPVLPARHGLTWEDHEWGACGWPEQPCAVREHRVTRCRSCNRAVRVQPCRCKGGQNGYSRDPQRDWWVHADCGWPTEAVLALPQVPEAADGTPTPLHRTFRARPGWERKLKPLPEDCAERDAAMSGRSYLD